MLVFILSVALTYVLASRTNLFLDNTPAVTIHKQIVLTPVVNGNGHLKYRAIYDKRAHCDVTGGAYEIKGKTEKDTDVHLRNVQPRQYGTWKVGEGQEVIATVEMPRDLPNGVYLARWSYSYHCAGAFKEQTITSPWMAFKRVRRSVHDFAAPVAP